MKDVLVSDIMTREPVSVEKDADLLECAKKMISKNIKNLMIIENNQLIGLISQRDILWAIIKKSPQELASIKAIDISPKKIETIKPSISVSEAFQRMKKSKFEKFPVVQDNLLVGVITIRDILNFHPELYPELEELKQIKEEEEKLKRVRIAQQNLDILEGICEECGGQDILHRFNGMVICESCKNSS